MKKEWFLLSTATCLAGLITFVIIRIFAPTLLGIPADLQLVQISKEVPPFFDNVFREQDLGKKMAISDPYVNRMKPFYPEKGTRGPHDLLGFRNRNIPNKADVIIIGDSQTYGLNVLAEESWPFRVQAFIGEKLRVYNMSVPGWGAMEYFEMFKKSLFFSPKIVVVAFYSGNDPADSFIRAYGNDKWMRFRIDSSLTKADFPKRVYPPPEKDIITLEFKNGAKMQFTPKQRYVSNQDHPVIKISYEIMAKAAGEMILLAEKDKVKTIFTIIPTKELVYYKRFLKEGITIPPEYALLVKNEKENRKQFEKDLMSMSKKKSVYVDILSQLENASFQDEFLYPKLRDGHPLPGGYNVIAKVIGPRIEELLDDR